MAERIRPALPAPLPSHRWHRLGQQSLVVGGALYGFLLAAIFGLISSLDYVRSSGVLRPIFDDSYISLLFARNLAEHGKLTFDGLNWSTGATSPFHVAVMALPLRLGADAIMTSIVVGVVADVLLVMSVFALAWIIFRSRLAGVLAALAISFMGYTALDAGNGLETSLFLFLVTLSLASFLVAGRPATKALTGLIIGLAILTRPEGAALLPAIAFYRWLTRDPDEPLLAIVKDIALLSVAGIAALACITGLSLAVNGSLVGTATAKMAFFQDREWTFEEKINEATTNVMQFGAPIIALCVLAATGVRRREVMLFALFWVPVLVAYVLLFPGGLLHYFYRYQHPVLPLIAVLAGGGAAYLINEAIARRDLLAGLLVAAGLTVVGVHVWWQYDTWHGIYRDSSHEVLTGLETMAGDLNTIIGPDEVLATHDIGVVGYYGNYRVMDLVGLVNPDVVPYHKGRRIPAYLETAQFDYLLIFPTWDSHFLSIDPASHPERYEFVKEYEPGRLRGTPYVLWKVIDP